MSSHRRTRAAKRQHQSSTSSDSLSFARPDDIVAPPTKQQKRSTRTALRDISNKQRQTTFSYTIDTTKQHTTTIHSKSSETHKRYTRSQAQNVQKTNSHKDKENKPTQKNTQSPAVLTRITRSHSSKQNHNSITNSIDKSNSNQQATITNNNISHRSTITSTLDVDDEAEEDDEILEGYIYEDASSEDDPDGVEEDEKEEEDAQNRVTHVEVAPTKPSQRDQTQAKAITRAQSQPPGSSTAPAPTSASDSSVVSSSLSTSTIPAAIAKWQASLKNSADHYSDCIFTHLRQSECLSMPSPRYMDQVQGDVTFPMRAILIDWLVEVTEEYHLQAQTLYLGISYTDRFLAVTPIDRSRLQLVGITAMLIASKYWELVAPTIEDFVYISDHTYKREQVLEMERAMLTCLKFQLTIPTAWEFSKAFTKVYAIHPIQEALMEYLMEAFLQEPHVLNYPPSIIATSALYLATHTAVLSNGNGYSRDTSITTTTTAASATMTPPSVSELFKVTGYTVADLRSCLYCLYNLHVRLCMDPNSMIAAGATGLKAVKDKYSKQRFGQVARLKPRASIVQILQ